MKFIELQISPLDKDVHTEGRLTTIAIDSIISVEPFEGEGPAWKGVSNTSVMTFGRDSAIRTVLVALHWIDVQSMLASRGDPIRRYVLRDCISNNCDADHVMMYDRPDGPRFRCLKCNSMW